MSAQPFPNSPSRQPTPEPAAIYTNLRSSILQLHPEEVGLEPSTSHPNVWGILMEMGFPEVAVTLVSLAEGTTSLYFGTGGGILGAGGHEPVAAASQAFIAQAETNWQRLSPTAVFPLPDVGRVRFYALTYHGAFTAEASGDDLASGLHPHSLLFGAGQSVITQLRLMQAKQTPS